MKQIVLALLLAAPAWSVEPLDGQVEEGFNALSRITGLAKKHRVTWQRITRDEVNQYLRDRIRKEVKPEDIRIEELTLKTFGLLPPDYDLAKSTVELLTEQAAAFYDFRKKKLFLTDWTPSSTEDSVLIHELSHALADQHFALEKFIKEGEKTDDGSVARMAVMEGQATWLMSEWMVNQRGQSLLHNTALAEAMSIPQDSSGQFPVLDKTPLYLRETLLFPYSAGMRFQQAVVEKLGPGGFREVFQRPPQSTREILHPEAYFAKEKQPSPEPPPLEGVRGFKKVSEGGVGELDFSILLRQYRGEQAAARVSTGWRGGRFVLYERKKDRRAVLAFSSEWASEAAALDFQEEYAKVLAKKWKRYSETRAAGRISGTGDNGGFVIRLEGLRVSAVEGLPEAEGGLAR